MPLLTAVGPAEGLEAMLTIDNQLHAYERNHPSRHWAGVLHGPAEVAGDDMAAAMDAVGSGRRRPNRRPAKPERVSAL